MPRLVVRPAAVTDAAAIAAVHVRAWQAGYAHVLPASYLAGLDVRERAVRWHERLSAGGSAVLVCLDGDRLVGFVSFGPRRADDGDDTDAGRAGEVYAIYVDPACWGAGVGRALLGEAQRRLAVTFAVVTLWVLEDNPRARRFYEGAGWSPDGVAKDAEIGGVVVREVRYRRTLTPERR
ncbi:MAG TPA: GNAT family N-acetyltransferase [Angustibacter sp.]|nr:GNAT family N-acetyltransferase [Angustibacter sp.]